MADVKNIRKGQILYEVSIGCPSNNYIVREYRVKAILPNGKVEVEFQLVKTVLKTVTFNKSRIRSLKVRRPKNPYYGHSLLFYRGIDD